MTGFPAFKWKKVRIAHKKADKMCIRDRVYAYYQNGGKNLDTAEKELFFSLSKAYDLYNYLLLLMVCLLYTSVIVKAPFRK